MEDMEVCDGKLLQSSNIASEQVAEAIVPRIINVSWECECGYTSHNIDEIGKHCYGKKHRYIRFLYNIQEVR